MASIALSNQVRESYRVNVDQYRLFREQGFLVVKNLVPSEEVAEMNAHMDRMLRGEEQPAGAKFMKNLDMAPKNPEEWLRVHMLHRVSEIHE